jgi:TonB family protein
MKISGTSRGKLIIIFMLLSLVTAQAQNANQKQTCGGPVYLGSELTHRAKITSRSNPSLTPEALAHGVHGRVVVEAILCRTGRVTDLRVMEGLPYGMTERALAAVLQTRFTPAEMNWHTVSQRIRFEFGFNESGNGEIGLKDAVGREIEAVEIVGNRRISEQEILSRLKTRPGELYNSDQITQDFNAVLATGYFDKLRSRVTIEDGVRGGIGVIFFVVELPLISEVKFDGLKQVDRATVLKALLEAHIDLRKGAVFDSGQSKLAIRVIKDLLASRGLPNAKVELQIESVTATTLSLTFVISSE